MGLFSFLFGRKRRLAQQDYNRLYPLTPKDAIPKSESKPTFWPQDYSTDYDIRDYGATDAQAFEVPKSEAPNPSFHGFDGGHFGGGGASDSWNDTPSGGYKGSSGSQSDSYSDYGSQSGSDSGYDSGSGNSGSDGGSDGGGGGD